MSFRATGLPESANVVNATAGASSNLVTAPGTDEHIVIYDVVVQKQEPSHTFSKNCIYFKHTPTVIRINPNFLGAQAEMAVRGSTAPRKLGLIKQT